MHFSPARQARRLLVTLATLAATLALTSSASAAVTFEANPNTGPPATLGPYTLTQFPDETRPLFTQVANVPSPLGGDVVFAPTMGVHRAGQNFGSAWATGALPYVYFSNFQASQTLTMPAGTGAFNFYIEPNVHATFTFEAVAQDGTSSGVIPLTGNGGGQYFGFYATGGDTIDAIVVRNVDGGALGFGIGAFGIAAAAVEEQPEFVQCYDVEPEEDEDRTVTITDQFGSKTVSIGQALRLCTPTDVDGAVGESFDLESPHYVCYSVSRGFQAGVFATVTNRFDEDDIEVDRAKQLCVISTKTLGGGGEVLTAQAVDTGFVDHYQCYDLNDTDDIETTVSARDQFGTFNLRARRMIDLCAPADKNGEGAPDFDGPHYACYQTDRDHRANQTVTVTNQFGSEEMFVGRARRLCAASEKTLEGEGGGPVAL